jgi:hypothetical protein
MTIAAHKWKQDETFCLFSGHSNINLKLSKDQDSKILTSVNFVIFSKILNFFVMALISVLKNSIN